MKKPLIAGALIIIVLLIAAAIWFSESRKSCATQHGDCGAVQLEENTAAHADGAEPAIEGLAPGKSPDHTSPDTDKDTSAIVPGEQGLVGARTISIPAGTSVASADEAQSLVDAQAQGLGLNVVTDSRDNYGNSYYQLTQRINGVPVYGANAVLEVIQGDAESIYGAWQDEADIDVTPTFTAEQALIQAAENMGGTAEVNVKLTREPELVIYVSTQKTHLAWHVTAFISPTTQEEVVIVDANEPQFLLRTTTRVH
ncbi:hypothetical protein [Teredinibacter purpureus]|uniref:hypothetical protein n=1 Tax=Teredinibacter purpureus TaxID=2731756 RepID=UPI0005F86DA4|nr:hypothetical protein [Teredinibacter purpureus]